MAVAVERPVWQRLGATCLLHWHLCSLDAPTVAVVWAITLERLAKVPLHWREMLVLGLGTWIVYVLDRVLDGAPLPHTQAEANLRAAPVAHLKERHHFHSRHRRVLLRLCSLATILLAVLCVGLPTRLIAFYLALSLPVMLYAIGVHRRLLWHASATLPGESDLKEAGVACLFTAAVAGPALMLSQPAYRWPLLVAALLLAALCWLNCSLISHAEAASFENRRQRQLQTAGCGLALTSAAMAGLGAISSGNGSHAAGALQAAQAAMAAILLSSLLLVTLLRLRDAPGRLRIMADVGLLTPLLLLLPRF